MFSLAQAHKALVEGDIADAALRARFDKDLQAFLSLAETAKHYPCVKRAWVEFRSVTVRFKTRVVEMRSRDVTLSAMS